MALGCEMLDRSTKSISMEELKVASQPLIDLLNTKGDPYVIVSVRQGCVSLLRQEVVVPFEVPD